MHHKCPGFKLIAQNQSQKELLTGVTDDTLCAAADVLNFELSLLQKHTDGRRRCHFFKEKKKIGQLHSSVLQTNLIKYHFLTIKHTYAFRPTSSSVFVRFNNNIFF